MLLMRSTFQTDRKCSSQQILNAALLLHHRARSTVIKW